MDALSALDVDPLDAPLTPPQFRRLAFLSRHLPIGWISTPRRRRLLVVASSAPGFLLLWTTPLHRSFAAMVLGVLLFAAAQLFRRLTEPVFVRAEAAALWPPATATPHQEI